MGCPRAYQPGTCCVLALYTARVASLPPPTSGGAVAVSHSSSLAGEVPRSSPPLSSILHVKTKAAGLKVQARSSGSRPEPWDVPRASPSAHVSHDTLVPFDQLMEEQSGFFLVSDGHFLPCPHMADRKRGG